MLHARMVGPAEAQRVHVRDRPRTHREHVAQNAADARRCTLIRLDVARVVVRLHLEDRGLPVTDVDYAGIFAGAANDLRPGRGKFLQVDA